LIKTMPQRAGFTFCICPDAYITRECIHTQLAECPPEGGKAWEEHIHWGDEELSAQFWEQLTLQGLFGTPRALIVRNAQAIPAAVWKKISAALAKPNAQCWPFFCLENAWEKGQPKLAAHIAKLPCLAFADKQRWVWRNAGLDARSLRQHIQKRSTALGIRYAAGALEALCAAVPPDAATIENELQKLAVFHGTAISPAMTQTAGWRPEFDIFAFIRLVQAGNTLAAWEQISRGKKDDDGLLFPFLALLLREARLLWQICMGERVRLHPNDATQKQALARTLGAAGVAKLIKAVMYAEWQVKAGERSPEQALDALVAELGLLFAR
jgi:DNA polymerase III subunit delta